MIQAEREFRRQKGAQLNIDGWQAQYAQTSDRCTHQPDGRQSAAVVKEDLHPEQKLDQRIEILRQYFRGMILVEQAVRIANVIVTVILGLIGLYLVHSVRRDLALSVADKRLAAYIALWGRMICASPVVRVTKWKHKPLTPEEREKLFDDFTAWYYGSGNGVLVGGGTRSSTCA